VITARQSGVHTVPPKQAHWPVKCHLALDFSISQRYCPEAKKNSSSWLYSALKYVFYIRFAHQFASQWDEFLSLLLKRKSRLFIATRGNNERLQEPQNSMPPSKQIDNHFQQ
jgi:hypothetical protein